MVERRLFNYFESIEPPREPEISRLVTRINWGLKLEQGIPGVPQVIKDKIIQDIAENIYYSANFLGIRYPNVGLIHSWGTDIPFVFRDVNARGDPLLTEAMAFMGPRRTVGLIAYEPFYLLEISRFLQGEDIAKVGLASSLVRVTAHECYHLSQYQRYLRFMHNGREKRASSQSLEKRIELEERGAEIFEQMYLRARAMHQK